MTARSLALVFVLAIGSACDGGDPPTVQPEPVATLVLHASYGDLMVSMLGALRTGDLAAVQASIATPGQIESMCPGYTVTATPYTPPSIEVAANDCRSVFAPIPDDVFESALATDVYGRNHQPEFDSAFQTHWRDRCPAEFQVYQIWGVFEAIGEGTPQAGFEVSDIFTYQGRWGLMSIPRCRGPEAP